MKRDPIVEELHYVRDQMVARFRGDLRALCEDARRRQEASGRPKRRLPPRPPAPAKAR